MIPKACRRLAEADFPIAVVSRHAAREKSIRHGHPSTLHLWWARRPLASCRAVLLAILWPDPCDPLCPDEFKVVARVHLPEVGCNPGTTDHDLRSALLKFIGQFSDWDLAANPTCLAVARGLVAAAHGPEPPLVVDPFAGGGSIPLEALRVGCEAFASDLNPVACLILKVMLEDIPRHGPALAEELRKAGAEIKRSAERELAELYPADPDGAIPIAYLWARTVRCEAPDCGAEIPLVRSFWLCRKKNHLRALRYGAIPRPSPPTPLPEGEGREKIGPLPEGEGREKIGPLPEGVGPNQGCEPSPSRGAPIAQARWGPARGQGEGLGGGNGDTYHGPLVIPQSLREFARALRLQSTDAETKMWHLLRDRRIAGAKFRRQHPVPPYIVDFYCHEAALVVEIDGSQHGENRHDDERRTGLLEARGLRVLRFWNNDVSRSPEAVLEAIWHALRAPSPPTPLPEGEGRKDWSPLPEGEGSELSPFGGSPSLRRDGSPARGQGEGSEKAQAVKPEFEIFSPANEREVAAGTVSRAKATCLCCGVVLPPDRVRAQLAAQRGGADVIFDAEGRRAGGARLLAVVTLRPGESGRHYRLPEPRDYEAARKAQLRLAALLQAWEDGGRQGLCPVPDEPTPTGGGSGAGRAFSVRRYGMLQWGDLFTARQKVALATLSRLVAGQPEEKNATDRASMAMALGRCGEQSSSLVRWRISVEAVAGTFGRQALPMMWDFAEIDPTGDLASNFAAAVEWVAEVVDRGWNATQGQIQSADATRHPLPDETAAVWFTDPPYYDAIPYADLSDFFYVWLKRVFPGHRLLRDPDDAANPLTPKQHEAVQDETKRDDERPKDRAWFEEAMAKAFAEGRRVTREDGVGAVVFAHKTTEGWEALLSGMIRGGWTITGSWPIATERPGRLRARDSAALATSVHLICRPRPDDTGIGDWADVLRELPKRVGEWMERLQSEGVRGADLVFACIGPALEIFSRHPRVETAEGEEVTLAKYLEKVWEVVGRSALERVLGTEEAAARNGALGVLEEDARLTALFLWTLQSTDGHAAPAEDGEAVEAEANEDDEGEAPARARGPSLIFDVVRRFAQPLGIGLGQWEGRIIETAKGTVRLLPVAERARQLFGAEGAEGVALRLEREASLAANPQGVLFPEMAAGPPRAVPIKGRAARAPIADSALRPSAEATTLDRVHAAMLLQVAGRANALKTLIRAEQERGSDFLRLANALSALYPSASEEKRLLDAMLLAAPR